jgi:hypothetical protein
VNNDATVYAGYSRTERNVAKALADSFVTVSDRERKVTEQRRCFEQAASGATAAPVAIDVPVVRGAAAAAAGIVRQQSVQVDERPVAPFEQREFIYLLRYLRKHANALGTIALTPDLVIRGLERHFGGMPFPEFRSHVVKPFLERLTEPCGWGAVDVDVLLPGDRTLESLRESLAETRTGDEDPNMSAFRHVLIIDDADAGDCALAMLLQPELKLLKSPATPVLRGTGFSEDTSDRANLDRTRYIKDLMESAGQVVLVNTADLHAAFYDVFNAHLQPVGDSRGGRKWFSTVAVGSHSETCYVHENFRFVVIMSAQEYLKAPLPFLSRFEKYRMSPSLLLQQNGPYAHLARPARLIEESILHFVSAVHVGACSSGLFCGLQLSGHRVAQENESRVLRSATVSSLLLRAVLQTDSVGSSVIV